MSEMLIKWMRSWRCAWLVAAIVTQFMMYQTGDELHLLMLPVRAVLYHYTWDFIARWLEASR